LPQNVGFMFGRGQTNISQTLLMNFNIYNIENQK